MIKSVSSDYYWGWADSVHPHDEALITTNIKLCPSRLTEGITTGLLLIGYWFSVGSVSDTWRNTSSHMFCTLASVKDADKSNAKDKIIFFISFAVLKSFYKGISILLFFQNTKGSCVRQNS